MYKRLKYKVVIKQPARTIEGEIVFEQGMTAITGPNGSGKSMVLEMIQFAEFGTSALRGATKTYESIDVELDWVVNGVPYSVERSLGHALLICNGARQATGTKPVNLAILKIHGYSYDVYKLANLCAQGEIEALGTMRPGERKAMVDEVIGLNALDNLSDFIQKEITAKNTAISTLEPLVVKPEAPVKPEGMQPREFYEVVAKTLGQQVQRKAILASIIAKPIKEPLAAKFAEDDDNLASYEAMEVQRQTLMAHYSLLQNQRNAIPAFKEVGEVKLHAEDSQLDVYRTEEAERLRLGQNRSNIAAEKVRLRLPVHTLVELAKAEAANIMHDRWKQKQVMIANRVPHDCPACQHHWDDEDPRLKTEFADVPDDEPVMTLTTKQVADEKALLPNVDRVDELNKQIDALDEQGRKFTPRYEVIIAIEAARKAYAAAEQDRASKKTYDNLTQQLADIDAAFAELPDRSDAISFIKAARENVAEFQRQKLVYDAALLERTTAQQELDALPADLEDQVGANYIANNAALVYETKLTAYNEALKKYQELFDSVEVLKAALADWKAGKTAVAELRARVKGYIVPALNSVASALLSEMTGGELSWLQVNEDFEISVDGQDISTLSGAGKGVANLALRFALGQVLTHKAFPVVLLDEIDASFDDARAAYTAACVRRLSSVFKQVLIVSHKQGLVADHNIQLGAK